MRRLVLGVALALLASGCGGSDESSKSSTTLSGAPLDCAWLASDNCWKTTAKAAASCVPDPTSWGTLSADGKTCTYASGTNVTFETPLVLPLDSNDPPEWHFVETTGGEPCVTYDYRPNSAQTLSVKGMTYSETTSGLALQITCPDGSQFAAQDSLNLLECADIFTDAPGYTDGYDDTSVSFSLFTGDMPLQVFDCRLAQ